MSCTYRCDQCGKEEAAEALKGVYLKPETWFQRTEKEIIHDVCSMDCALKLNSKTGKDAPILS